MTVINNHHSHQYDNRSRQSHSSNGARRSSNHYFSNDSRSNRQDHSGRSRRNRMRSPMSIMGNQQSNQLRGSHRGNRDNSTQNHHSQCGQRYSNDTRMQNDSRFQTQPINNNDLSSINPLLQNFGDGNNSIDQILQGLLGGNGNANTNSGDIQQLIQSLISGLTSSDGDFSSILNSFGNEQIGATNIKDIDTFASQQAEELINPLRDQLAQLGFDSNLINSLIPQEVVINDQVGDLNDLLDQLQADGQITAANNSNDTDPLAEIQSLLQGFDMGNLSSLLQDVSAGDLSELLQQETGMNVSSDEITQLLQQFGLSINTVDSIAVEADNNVSNHSTTPSAPETENTDPLADIQSLLQGFDMDGIGSLLQAVSPEELSALLQQESGMNISANEITQLLQQLGLTALIDANNSPATEPANISTTIDTPAATNNSDSSNDIQSLLQGIDPDDITLLLESVSVEQLAAMLQQESGLTISTDDINQLLQQLQQDTSIPNSNPIPVEPNNGIGDGAPNLGDLLGQTNNTNTTTSSDVNEVLQSINPDLLSELLQMVSLDDLASMLQQESGVSTSTEQIQQLLNQLGLTDANTPATQPALANTEEVQSLVEGIDSNQLTSLFDLFSTEELAQILNQEEGTDISANEVESLLSQLGLSA